MRAVLWGTRGSVSSAGAPTVLYGGETACVEVRANDGSVLLLDAGSGARRLGLELAADRSRVDILLTHLHMDHIVGLGFFAPLYDPEAETHIWGPAAQRSLSARLSRYLSPPLFPVALRDLPAVHIHEVGRSEMTFGPFRVHSDYVCHPGGATVGYRVEADGGALAYLPDHEPALGTRTFPDDPAWTSGYQLAAGVDLLLHDAQYTAEEYASHVGWGHSSIEQAVAFARLAGVRRLVSFHHDPAHSDAMVDAIADRLRREQSLPFEFVPGVEGATYEVAP